MPPQVYDVQGVQHSWGWLQDKYKCGLTPAPAGTAFRLVRVDETEGPAVFILNVCDQRGLPMQTQPVAQWWPGAEADEKAESLVGVGLQSVYHARAIVEHTNAGGDIGFPYGAGGVIHATGPYEFWILSPSYASDALTGAGWLGGTNHACPGRLTFQVVSSAPPPVPPVPPVPDPESEIQYYAQLLAHLSYLSQRVDAIAQHFGVGR